jgi:hypothetical protein
MIRNPIDNMIRNPADVATRVSPELSELIVSIIDQQDSGEPLTLGAVRAFITHDYTDEDDETEDMHHFDVEESVVDELDELIEQFGESASAEDFISVFASEALSCAIEEVINDENRENPATLEAVKEALNGGLAGRLIGDGVLEEDEADMLMPELEDLIDLYGEDAPAEDFLRYE